MDSTNEIQQSSKNSTFIRKLWNLVNNADHEDVIGWSPNGKSFVICHDPIVWNQILPKYFKHNNMSSFVRQLNLYGFYKMASEGGCNDLEKSQSKFSHPCFMEGHPELLTKIIRKPSNHTKTAPKVTPSGTDNNPPNLDISKVLTDVSKLRGRQETVDQQLATIKSENIALWRELSLLRTKHNKQTQIVNRLIQFLLSLVQPKTRLGGLGMKRKLPLMINDNPGKVTRRNSDGPIIQEINSDQYNDEDVTCGFQVQSPDSCGDVNNIANVDTDSLGDATKEQQFAALLDAVPPTSDDCLNAGDLFAVESLSEDDSNASAMRPDFVDAPVEYETEEQRVQEDANDNLNRLISGKYNAELLNKYKASGELGIGQTQQTDLTVAQFQQPPELQRANSVNDISDHVNFTQSELDSIKDLVEGFTKLNNGQILELFNDDLLLPNLDQFDFRDDYQLADVGPSNSLAFNDPMSDSVQTYVPPTSLDLEDLLDNEDDNSNSPKEF